MSGGEEKKVSNEASVGRAVWSGKNIKSCFENNEKDALFGLESAAGVIQGALWEPRENVGFDVSVDLVVAVERGDLEVIREIDDEGVGDVEQENWSNI